MPNRPGPARRLAALLCAGLAFAVAAAHAQGPRDADRASTGRRAKLSRPAAEPGSALPASVAAIVARSGLPAKSFALEVRPVESGEAPPLLSWRAEQQMPLASTAKIVTSLAALELLGAQHRWPSSAYATGPVSNDGRLRGDLVIVGGPVGLTGNELRRWFLQLRADGLKTISGNIVLDGVSLLHEREPKQVQATAAERALDLPPEARSYNLGKLVVSVRPAKGERAAVSVKPRPANVLVVNDVLMGDNCAAWASWKPPEAIGRGPPLQLWVRGRWRPDCPAEAIAFVQAPASMRLEPELGAAPALPIPAPRMVADLWTETGGSLRGQVIERDAHAGPPRRAQPLTPLATPVAEVVREMNKTSNNEAARSVLLALAPDGAAAPSGGRAHEAALRAAQRRLADWLRSQGLREADLSIVVGSGQLRAERGRPRALVDLLRAAWRGASSQALLDSLPIAGIDGTLANRMKSGAATGQAYLKTGTLSDTRALAGYVRAKSGRIYAVSLIACDPQAVQATPALDAIVEWVASSG